MDSLELRIAKAYEGALATRGKYAGMLKANCPPMGTDAGIMWQALMLYANPHKVGLGHLLCGSLTDPEFKAACDSFALKRAELLPRLDRDRVALTKLGAW